MLEALRKPLLSAMREASQVASLHGHPVLAVASIVIPRLDLLSIFTRYSPYMDVNLWFSFTKRSMLGLGTAFECIGTGVDRFSFVSDSWHNIIKKSVVNGGTPPVAFGGFRFDTASPMSSMWTGFMDGVLIIPRITILQGEGETDCCRIIAADHVPPKADVTSRIESMLSTWAGLQGDWDMASANPESRVAVFTPEDAKAQWHDLVQAALSSISRGPIKKIVVARMIRAKAEVPFFLPNILNRLCADNPKATIFTFSRKGTYFVGATPEILITSSAGSFQTMALAGSAPRSEDPVQDFKYGQQLLASAKERSEHDFVVQDILRTLKPYCRYIIADNSPALHKLRKVQHLATFFKGEMLPQKSLLDMISFLHPTPVVGGVLFEPALTFLREHEGFDRGWYAGPIGWLDAERNGEFMVALRSGVIQGREAALFAGCGLVADSDSEKEYQETQLKLLTMLDALCPSQKVESRNI